jgi:hypothetical protein
MAPGQASWQAAENVLTVATPVDCRASGRSKVQSDAEPITTADVTPPTPNIAACQWDASRPA